MQAHARSVAATERPRVYNMQYTRLPVHKQNVPRRYVPVQSWPDKVSSFVEDKKLKEKAQSAMKTAQQKATDVAEQVGDSARRTYIKLDAEYDIDGKVRRATTRMRETAIDIDQKYSVTRRTRDALETLQRRWPVWKSTLDEFTATPVGKAAVIVGVVFLLTTDLFWRLLNIVLLLWWLAIPLSMFLVSVVRRQQEEAMAAEEERVRRAQNPFSDIFGGTQQWQNVNASNGGRGRGSAGSRGSQSKAPIIIEAEWTPIDDKKR